MEVTEQSDEVRSCGGSVGGEENGHKGQKLKHSLNAHAKAA